MVGHLRGSQAGGDDEERECGADGRHEAHAWDGVRGGPRVGAGGGGWRGRCGAWHTGARAGRATAPDVGRRASAHPLPVSPNP
jgi:hypothetical protein